MTTEAATVFLVLIGMGALFAWVSCVLVGCRLLAPDHAIALGVSGLWIGWVAFRKLGLPLGPALAGVEVAPGLVGTTALLVVYLLLRALYDRHRERSEAPPPRPLDRDLPRFLRNR